MQHVFLRKIDFMKHPLFFFPLALLITSTAFADKPRVVSLGKEGKAEVRLAKGQKTDIALQIFKGGKLLQTFPNLGAGQGKISFAGSESSIVVTDLDKDGTEEILLRTTQPPIIGSLWVFQWDKAKKAFAYVNAESERSYLPVPLAEKVSLEANGNLSFPMPGKTGLASFQWSGKGFVAK